MVPYSGVQGGREEDSVVSTRDQESVDQEASLSNGNLHDDLGSVDTCLYSDSFLHFAMTVLPVAVQLAQSSHVFCLVES